MATIMNTKPRSARRLASTLSIAFFALSVVILMASGGFQLFFNLQTQQQSIYSKQQLISQDAAKTVSHFIQDKFSILATTVELLNSTDLTSEEQTRSLKILLGLQPAFHQLVLFDAHNKQIALASHISKPAAQKFTSRITGDVLAQIRKGPRYASPVYFEDVSSEPLMFIAVPAIDALGNYQGTLIAEVSLKFMWDLVDQLTVGATGVAYVVDGQGNLIAYRDTARVLRGENLKNLREVKDFLASSPSHDTQTSGLSEGIEGTLVVGSFASLGTPDWAVVTELPWQEAYSGVIQMALVSIGIMLVMAVAASLLGTYLARRLVIPLVNLTETATRIAGGEMKLQIELGGSQEAIRLGVAFNSMTAQLRELIGSLEQRVEDRTRKLEQAYETLQKQQQALVITEKMASLGRLTAGIAHEMNTPLAAVRAALANAEELIKEYQASIGDASVSDKDHYEIARELHSAAQLADKAAERAAGFVRGIKSQTLGLAAQEGRPIDAVVAVEDALLLLNHALRQGKCALDFKKPDDEIRLVGVPGRLEQIVTNLVNNAIDASYPQGGAITLSLEKHLEFVELQVSDHGSGIPPENISKIYDPMFSTKPFGSSTGLGLTIVHDIVMGEFGGSIDVASEVGQGTTFTIRLPLRK
jgi:two-component system NtrC family sensor kinase